jgi:hypothetical protein
VNPFSAHTTWQTEVAHLPTAAEKARRLRSDRGLRQRLLAERSWTPDVPPSQPAKVRPDNRTGVSTSISLIVLLLLSLLVPGPRQPDDPAAFMHWIDFVFTRLYELGCVLRSAREEFHILPRGTSPPHSCMGFFSSARLHGRTLCCSDGDSGGDEDAPRLNYEPSGDRSVASRALAVRQQTSLSPSFLAISRPFACLNDTRCLQDGVDPYELALRLMVQAD